jgi:hypothetical protein
MLRRVALVRTDVSEEPSASFIRVTRIGELETTLAVTSNRRTLRRNILVFLCSVPRLLVRASVVSGSPILATLMKEALSCSEESSLKSHTILHSHRRENLKPYMYLDNRESRAGELWHVNHLLDNGPEIIKYTS